MIVIGGAYAVEPLGNALVEDHISGVQGAGEGIKPIAREGESIVLDHYPARQ